MSHGNLSKLMKLLQKNMVLVMAIFLLFSNAGLSVNYHYCKGVLEKISLSFPKASDKDCCSKESHHCQPQVEKTFEKKCCKDETVKQISSEQVFSKTFQLTQEFVSTEIQYIPASFLSEEELVKKDNFVAFYWKNNAPPLYKLYHQYLLYA